MKKWILLLAFTVSISGLAIAQQTKGKTPQQKAKHLTSVLQMQLHLTSEQTSKVNAVLLTQATRLDSLKISPKGNKKTRRQLRQSILAQTDQKMNGILNAEQQKAYTSFKEAKKGKLRKEKTSDAQSE